MSMKGPPPAFEDNALEEAVARAQLYMERNNYRGYDPYDALTSPIFDLPLLRSRKLVRLAAQQGLRRLPVNIRPLLGIRRGFNPVTLGLAVQGHADLAARYADDRAEHRAAILTCIASLHRLQSRGYSGACWGYDFPWEARYGQLEAFTPSIVATGIITNGLFRAYEVLKIEEALALCVSACDFLTEDLDRSKEPDDSFCWGYYPNDRQRVINATLKGARLCAQVFSITRNERLRSLAYRSARFAVKHQRADGAWPYAVGDRRTWVDHFHTGYVLESLKQVIVRTGDGDLADAMRRGWKYYRSHFFESEYVPRYYDTKTYPIDVTACAQAILTLCEFDDAQTRDATTAWALHRLQKRDGAFIYQIRRTHTNRITYMRWGVAWMFAALARVALLRESADRPLAESRIATSPAADR